jgi:hypothetical protein
MIETQPTDRFTTWTEAKPILIFAGNYTGDFKVDGGGPFRGQGPENSFEICLLEGWHEISFLSGYFLIEVDDRGNISQVKTPVAAKHEGNKLFFQTQKIVIDPGAFGAAGGKCELNNYPAKPHELITMEKRPFHLVTGVLHQFDSGAHIGQAEDKKLAGSYMSFMVHQDGTVWSNSSAANGGDRVLRVNGGFIRIRPSHPELMFEVGVNCHKPNGDIDWGSYYQGAEVHVPVILGLRTRLLVREQSIGPKVYRQAWNYFNPEYGSDDWHDLIVGDAAFLWTVVP